jgi:zinc finger protein
MLFCARALPSQEDSPEVGAAVAVVIARLMQLSMGEGDCFPFTIELDDPSGNSFVENYCAPKADPKLKVIQSASLR